jgi:hypothetical protein
MFETKSFTDKCNDILDKEQSHLSENHPNHFKLLFDLQFILTELLNYINTGSGDSIIKERLLRLKKRGILTDQKLKVLKELFENKDIANFVKSSCEIYISSLDKVNFVSTQNCSNQEDKFCGIVRFFSINMFIFKFGVSQERKIDDKLLHRLFDLLKKAKDFNEYSVNGLLIEYYLYNDLTYCFSSKHNLETRSTKTIFYKSLENHIEVSRKIDQIDASFVSGIACLNVLRETLQSDYLNLDINKPTDIVISTSGLFLPKINLRELHEKMKQNFRDAMGGDLTPAMLNKIRITSENLLEK